MNEPVLRVKWRGEGTSPHAEEPGAVSPGQWKAPSPSAPNTRCSAAAALRAREEWSQPQCLATHPFLTSPALRIQYSLSKAASLSVSLPGNCPISSTAWGGLQRETGGKEATTSIEVQRIHSQIRSSLPFGQGKQGNT